MSTTTNLSSFAHPAQQLIELTSYTKFPETPNDSSPREKKKVIALFERANAIHAYPKEITLSTPKELGCSKDRSITLLSEDSICEDKSLLVGTSFDPVRSIWNSVEAIVSGTVWFTVGVRYALPKTCPLLSFILEGKTWQLFNFAEYPCCGYVPQAINLAFIGGCTIAGLHIATEVLPIRCAVKKVRNLVNCLLCK